MNVNSDIMKKPGRNDPCPCGSGKKFKKCCFNKVDFATFEKSPEKFIGIERLEQIQNDVLDLINKENGDKYILVNGKLVCKDCNEKPL